MCRAFKQGEEGKQERRAGLPKREHPRFCDQERARNTNITADTNYSLWLLRCGLRLPPLLLSLLVCVYRDCDGDSCVLVPLSPQIL